MKVFKGFRLNCFITFLNSIFTPLSLLQEDDGETEKVTEEEGERGKGTARGARRKVVVGTYSSDGEEMLVFLLELDIKLYHLYFCYSLNTHKQIHYLSLQRVRAAP